MTSPAPRSIYCDEDVPSVVALLLTQRGYAVHTPPEAGMVGQADAAILDYCRQMGWLLVTQNRRDFHRLHALWTTLYMWEALDKLHSGILTVYEQVQENPDLWAAAIDGFLQNRPDMHGKLFSWRNSKELWEEGGIALR